MRLPPRTLCTSDPRDSEQNGSNGSNGSNGDTETGGGSVNRRDHGILPRHHVVQSKSRPNIELVARRRRRGDGATGSRRWIGSDLPSLQLGAAERQQGGQGT